MSKQYTVITKDGSKWLSRTAPHGVDPIQWHSDNHDLPYIGSAKSGATLDESEVREVRQWRNKNSSVLTWWNIPDGDGAQWGYVNNADYLETRAAYTDAESTYSETFKQLGDMITTDQLDAMQELVNPAESHDRHVSDNPRYPLFAHMHDEHGLTLLDSELDEIARHAAPMTGVDYWKRRCKVSEQMIGMCPSDPKTYDEFCRLYDEWEQIIEEGRAYGN